VLVLIGGSTSPVLTANGYDPALATQPASVGIRLGMGLMPVGALAIFLVAMRFCPLGRAQVEEMRAK
jgi:Na+/melibiose symporter-like transporter